MKKTVHVTTKARPATRRLVERVLCDICGKKTADQYGNQRKCNICHRDICPAHTKYDPNEPSDYPDHWCPICARLKAEAASDEHKIKENYYTELEKLDAAIKLKSLAEQPHAN